MNDKIQDKRCTDCIEHSGIVKELKAGDNCMHRLETGLNELKRDFADHLKLSSKSTIYMLIGILMCFLTGVVGIYVNSNQVTPKDKYSSQAEMTLMVKAIASAIKEAKK